MGFYVKYYSEKIKFLLKNNPSELQKKYYELCKVLQQKKPEALERTKEERRFEERLCKVTRLHYFTNFWIGKYNFDFFFPSLFSRTNKNSFKGLVVEINGNIHHTQSKMRMDFKRVEYLASLNIASTVIENWDINNPTVMNLNYNLQQLPRMDSRAKKRLLNRIYYETLIKNQNHFENETDLNFLHQIGKHNASNPINITNKRELV
jgi:very-short-patch-repair endonuclease